MNAQQRREITEFVMGFHLPRYRELPDFGLHLEQVTRYVSRYIPAPITGSMVSNYVKQKIIPGPVKKSYPRESLAYLIFLSYIKTVMPLEDIRLMIGIQKNSYSLEVAYDYFCDELENLLQYACGMKETPDFIGVTHTEEKELLRTALLSITYKVYLDQSVKLIRANGIQTEEVPT
ncbi:MAG: DUF1836 domain-containing protein [Faecousia sp.]